MSVIFQSFKDYTINHPYMIIKNNKHNIKNSERDYYYFFIVSGDQFFGCWIIQLSGGGVGYKMSSIWG